MMSFSHSLFVSSIYCILHTTINQHDYFLNARRQNLICGIRHFFWIHSMPPRLSTNKSSIQISTSFRRKERYPSGCTLAFYNHCYQTFYRMQLRVASRIDFSTNDFTRYTIFVRANFFFFLTYLQNVLYDGKYDMTFCFFMKNYCCK